MLARRSLVVVPLVIAALASPGVAAPKPAKPAPQIVDAKGDSVGGHAAFDILSVEYKTSGLGSGKHYIPKKLSVVLTLAAPPQTEGLVSYSLTADTDSCGLVEIRYTPGTVTGGVIGDTSGDFGSCDTETTFFPAKVKGSVVTFELGLKAIGVDRGTEFSGFQADVDVSEPVTGVIGTDILLPGVLDTGTGDGTWVIP